MTKTRFLALLSVLALLAAMPLASVFAQQAVPPHKFYGMVVVDGETPPEGAMVTASVMVMVEGEDGEMMEEATVIGEAVTDAMGNYVLTTMGSAEYIGKEITFMVMVGEEDAMDATPSIMGADGSMTAMEAPIIYMQGALTQVDLKVTIKPARVSRSFSSPAVEPSGYLTVTIAGAGSGAAQVEETLPMGFSYVSSSLADSSVDVQGQRVTFTLFEDDSFTYTVTAPSAEGVYSFAGVLITFDRQETPISGPSTVTVGSVPLVGLSLDDSQPLMVRIGSPVVVIATFTEAVSGFTAGDITVSNGTVGNFGATAGGMVYTFDVTPSDIAAVTVDIAANVATADSAATATRQPRSYRSPRMTTTATGASARPK